MKKMTVVLAALLSVGVASSALAYETPTDAQIESILANHSVLNGVLNGASPAQAAETVVRTLSELEASTIPAASKEQTAALIYTRALLVSGENAPQFVQALAEQVEKGLLPVFAASTAIAVGNSEGPVFSALSGAAGSNAGQVSSAAGDPSAALGPELTMMIQQLIIELRGVAAPVIPPPATAPLGLVPPIVVENRGAGQPPPVASGYVNQ